MYGSVSVKDSESVAMLGGGRRNADMQDHVMSLKMTAVLIGVLQVLFMVFFSWSGSKISVYESGEEFRNSYSVFFGVELMVFVGFGYLMTFLKQYGVGAVGFTMMITVVGIQWAFFTVAFFSHVYSGKELDNRVNFDTLLPCLYAVTAVLISFGAVIGKISPFQLLIMTLLEIVCYSFNTEVFLNGNFAVADCGGAISIHMFATYFGLAVSSVIGNPIEAPSVSYTSDLFSYIGTLCLWLFFPTFIGGDLPAGSLEQQHAYINTVLALATSSCAAFCLSSLQSESGKFRPIDIQYATLAGGVTIGAVANLDLSPAMVTFIGAFAGTISTYGSHNFQPLLEELGIHDTCGIHNLHGLPSLCGGLFSVMFAYYLQKAEHVSTVSLRAYSDHAEGDQTTFQIYSIVWTLFFSILSGSVCGWVLKKLESGNPKFKDESVWD